jgi:transcriptional regulator with XRE-family HTH domain
MDQHLTPALCRAARGLLNWTPVRLASKAGMSEGVVRLFESGRRIPAPSRVASIRRALKAEGIVFTAAGVRLRGRGVAAPPSLINGEAGVIANSEM